jgi:ppGpp synthetase/RelA/SpoT-type nucleotidyltranferase
MEWAKPEYKKNQLNMAGRRLVDDKVQLDLATAHEMINNWRAAHYYPLNTFKVTLRRKSAEVDNNCLVAQRIKRLSSIALKLERYPTMKLSQMQDIGGCRSILSKITHVRQLVKKYQESDLKHELDAVDDYIDSPKQSGCRGVHLIYRCKYDKTNSMVFNGQSIEIQIRTKLQHSWATAVETVGTLLKQSLKSSQGEERWLRFFALVGSAFASIEKSPSVPSTPSKKAELQTELKAAIAELDAVNTLKMYGKALQVVEPHVKSRYRYFLLKLEPAANNMQIIGFETKDLDRATRSYLQAEKDLDDKAGAEAVLVASDSIQSLKRAYPNYFLDTDRFVSELEKWIA